MTNKINIEEYKGYNITLETNTETYTAENTETGVELANKSLKALKDHIDRTALRKFERIKLIRINEGNYWGRIRPVHETKPNIETDTEEITGFQRIDTYGTPSSFVWVTKKEKKEGSRPSRQTSSLNGLIPDTENNRKLLLEKIELLKKRTEVDTQINEIEKKLDRCVTEKLAIVIKKADELSKKQKEELEY